MHRVMEMQREIHLPVCMATSLQGYQKQIRCCSKRPRDIASGKSEPSAHFSSTEAGGGRRAASGEPVSRYTLCIVENSIWLRRSSTCSRFTRHQSNLFAAVCQKDQRGLTCCNTNPICSFGGTRAKRSRTQSDSSQRTVTS